jgi:hypothetical protein
MATLATRLGAVILAGAAGLVLSASPAGAQFNPYGRFNPNMAMNQGAQNLNTGRMAGQNPLLMGLNANAQGLGNIYAPNSPFFNPAGPNFTSMTPGVGSITSVPGGAASSPYGAPLSTPYGLALQNLGAQTWQNYDNGGGGYGYNYYYPDPYGGGLRGAAAAIAAQGDYEIAHQRSRVLNQVVEQAKIDTHHRILEEWLYEKAITPTLQQQQEATLAMELRRALRNPGTTEVISGYALDLILNDLKDKMSQGARGQAASIDPAILKQINVTSKASGGSIGALKPLKDGSPLPWPLPLQREGYKEEVRRFNQKAAEAVKLVQNTGAVDAGTLNDMRDDLDRLRAKVKSNINELLPTQVIEANRFLNQLDSALRALQQPDASKYVLDQFVAKGRTVPELVDYMASKGLSFAPAASGDETAYLALYNYLVGFDNSLVPPASPNGPK